MMKSVEKPLDALSTKSERVSASHEPTSAADRSLPGGRQQTATQQAVAGKAGFTESDPPGKATGSANPAEREAMADKDGKSAAPASTRVERGRIDPHLVCLLDPRSDQAETYYRLRHQLETLRQSDAALVVGVTSAGTGDGKSLTAINLAGALARSSDARILLLDLNLRRTGETAADYLGMKDARDRGIVDWAQGKEADPDAFTHYLEPFNLHVMTSGSNPEHPYELLKSSRLDELMHRARKTYDFVIVDSPQILRLPDTELISRLVDGFLIVVKAGHTRQARLEEALNLMTEAQVLGLVFNADPRTA
jgi:capsular exopolysaccharide synthesis family protein